MTYLEKLKENIITGEMIKGKIRQQLGQRFFFSTLSLMLD